MLHARLDYNARIQDAAVTNPGLLLPGTTAIGPDEPVFLLRASDKFAARAVMCWAAELENACNGNPTPQQSEEIAAARDHATRMVEYGNQGSPV